MKRDMKKQLFALFVLFMFLGSSIAFAIMSAFPEGASRPEYVFFEPLTNSQEAVYLQRNFVIIKFFYVPDCSECDDMEDTVDELLQDFTGNIIVEKINVIDFGGHAGNLGIEDVPTLYIKGRSVDILSEEIPYVDLYDKVCELFFEPIDQCYLFY